MRPFKFFYFEESTMLHRYLMLLVVFAAGVAAPLNQFKVPPMMHQLMYKLDISLALSGWLMSIFSVVGIILALPSGFIIRKIGMKQSGIISLTTLLIGSVIGGLSLSAEMILISRVIEGIGLCLLSVIGPAAISAWFPAEKRGFAMGVWASWIPFGTIIMFVAAPLLGIWQNVWIFSSVYSAAVLVIFILFFKMPENACREKLKAVALSDYYNKNIWLLAVVFMIFSLVSVAVKTYAPAYLEKENGLEPSAASMMTVLIVFFSLITAPFVGWLSDVLKSRKILLIIGLCMSFFAMTFLFSSGGYMFAMLLIVLGLAGGIVPTLTFSSATEIMKDPEHAGVGISIVTLGQNLGMFLGPVMFSCIAHCYSWQATGMVTVPLIACAVGIAVMIKIR